MCTYKQIFSLLGSPYQVLSEGVVDGRRRFYNQYYIDFSGSIIIIQFIFKKHNLCRSRYVSFHFSIFGSFQHYGGPVGIYLDIFHFFTFPYTFFSYHLILFVFSFTQLTLKTPFLLIYFHFDNTLHYVILYRANGIEKILYNMPQN